MDKDYTIETKLRMDIQAQFEEAIVASKSLKQKPDNDTLLRIYSLYKQATIGDAPTKGEYNMFDFVAKAKHEAWSGLRHTSKEQAMLQYITLIGSL